MKTIWKFPIRITDTQTVLMPKGAQILSVGTQGNRLFLWAMVDSNAALESREIAIFGTGHPLPDSELAAAFIGTTQQHEGALVWHVFDMSVAEIATVFRDNQLCEGRR